MKISASIYSSQNKDLPSLVKELDTFSVDYFHVDCFHADIEKVTKNIQEIKSYSITAIDLHMIGSDVDSYFALAQNLGVDLLSLQFENLQEPLIFPQQKNFRLGLALVNETPLEAIQAYASKIDYILLMTTTPGKSGGSFQKSSFERIRACKALYPHLPIYVDGGINAEISFILRLLGVNLAVSGSFLVNHSNLALAMNDLRFHQKGSHFLMEDFMLPKAQLPILNPSNTSFFEVLQTIENYKLGFVLFEENGKFVGMSSNADVRRGLLKNADNLSNIPIADLINTQPYQLHPKSSISEMLTFIKKCKQAILFLPIIDEKQHLLGAITFNELIKGEG